ncbi:MAG TPA: MBG domain-containing protein, partial [Clostridia bacterium]|nr:MBG domain-containing protein [Clostridia bacterium]
NISDSSFTPDEHDFQVRFFVVATGSQSQAQTSFTDGNVTLAVSGVGPGTTTNFQFTGYSDANCVTVANGQSWPKSQSITGNNSANMGLGNSNSVKVTIPSDPAGFAFSNWSGVGSGTARTSNCVQVPGGGGQNTVTITANFTATQASQTINFGPLSAKSYGDADFQVTATASSGLPVSFAVGVSDQCTISGSTVHITAAGSCIVTATQAGNSSFLPATPVAQAFSISKATLTVTPANASREYGDANPAFTGAIVGIKNGDAITASYASAATAASSVGTYPITATLSDPDSKLGNYNVTLNEGTLNVTAATLTITPANASREYGDANSAFTGAIVGIKNGDAITASYASLATAASEVGTYPITATLSDPDSKLSNYNVTLNEGTLTVTKAALTVTPANASREYGDANPAFTGTVVGIKNGDAITASYASLATATSSVGTYPITATLSDPDSKLGNYNVTLNEGTLTVTKATLTVTPANASREYGDANPAFTGAIAGIKNGDTITASYASLATAASAVGTYPITATLSDPDSKLGNYNVTLNEGTLTVTKAALTVKANDVTIVLHAAMPTLTGTITGIKNNDPISATYATSGTQNAVGTFTITPSVVDPNNLIGNYNVSIVAGTFKVTYLIGGMCAGDMGHQVLNPINAVLKDDVLHQSVFKRGSTVPTKFRVCDANGLSIGPSAVNGANIVTSYGVSGVLWTADGIPEGVLDSTTPDTNFRWDSTSQQWIFNTSTKGGAWQSQTYYFRIALNDGSFIDFHYALK